MAADRLPDRPIQKRGGYQPTAQGPPPTVPPPKPSDARAAVAPVSAAVSPADTPLRTPEQMERIRDWFKPDGLRRLARSTPDYYEQKGYYLPDVAALAYAEWDLAEKLCAAVEGLIEIAEMAMPDTYFASDSRVVAARVALEDGRVRRDTGRG